MDNNTYQNYPDSHVIDSLLQNKPSVTNSPQYQNMYTDVFGEQTIAVSRVVQIRYRMYSIILLLLSIIGIFNFLLPALEDFDTAKASYNAAEIQLQSIDTQIKQTQTDTKLINEIIQNESLIISCLQQLSGCEQVPESIQNEFSIARSYLLISSLYEPKMVINEKRILASLNEFLLRKDSTLGGRNRNGDITKIVIGNPEQVAGLLYRVPVDVNVSFLDKDGLLSFINNAEIGLFTEGENRVLYKINQIDYNIVKYQEEQDVSIKMFAYYYQLTQ